MSLDYKSVIEYLKACKDAQEILKDAEEKARKMLEDAKTKSHEIIREAEETKTSLIKQTKGEMSSIRRMAGLKVREALIRVNNLRPDGKKSIFSDITKDLEKLQKTIFGEK